MWEVTCKCGHRAHWFEFSTCQGHRLRNNQWHCKKCDLGWEVTPDGVKLIRRPGVEIVGRKAA